MHFNRIISFVAALTFCGSLTSAQVDTTHEILSVAGNAEVLEQDGHHVVQVSAGSGHVCALVQSGHVYCWGLGRSGQLGHGEFEDSGVPVQVKMLDNVRQVAAGMFHTCALQNTGQVWCWGDNGEFQLGDGSSDGTAIRVPVAGDHNAIQITAGVSHSCMITDDERAYCWGSNDAGKLGIGDRSLDYAPTPRPVAGPRFYTQIAAGGNHTCAITSRRRASCWGGNFEGQLGSDRAIKGIAHSPTKVARKETLARLIKIVAGFRHSCALREDGVVFCWGTNVSGQLGDGMGFRSDRDVPRRAIRLFNANDIVAGLSHTCALKENGFLVCWGSNDFGELGNGTTTGRSPVRTRVKELRNTITSVAAGNTFSCASTEDGSAYCWGSNRFGQLGNGTQDPTARVSRPVQVQFPEAP